MNKLTSARQEAVENLQALCCKFEPYFDEFFEEAQTLLNQIDDQRLVTMCNAEPLLDFVAEMSAAHIKRSNQQRDTHV